MTVADEVSSILGQVLQESNRIESDLEKIVTDHNRYACDDINQQLRKLLDPGFLRQLPFHWLKQYPRYLKAIRFRIDKLSSNLAHDRNALREVVDFSGAIADSYLEGSEMELFRWMVEEFRVSMFAQKLGTSLPVSAKRLQKQLRLIESEEIKPLG